jgi:hypothetical protein
MTTTQVGRTVRYKHSSYSIREGVIIEDAGEKVRVHWNREFFKNPDRNYLISIRTWVTKTRLEN